MLDLEYTPYDRLHAQRGLNEQRHERDKIHALVVVRDVHDDLEEQRCERDARSIAKIRKDRDDGDDGEDNGTRYRKTNRK